MRVPLEEPVTFVFVNRERVARNLTIGRDVPDADGPVTGFTEVLLAGLSARVEPPQAWIGPSERVPSVTIHVAPRGSTSVTLTFPIE